MPTYSYRCTECTNAFDIQQSFTDDSLSECPACLGRLRKVFSAIGVTFNGSGFYRNDSRAASKAATAASAGSSSSDSGSSGASSGSSGGSGSGASGSDSGAKTRTTTAASAPSKSSSTTAA